MGMDTTRSIRAYHGIMDQEGECQTFAEAYAFLLNQAGVEAIIITGYSYNK